MKNIIVATHSGEFHADDVFAYTVLKMLFKNVTLIRSRIEEELAKAEIVFDVGGGEFDHHMVDKQERENGVPYAAFGLIWKRYGKNLLRDKGIAEEDIQQVFDAIEERLVIGVDALDNGHDFVRDEVVHLFNISSLIASFNPKFGEDKNYDTAFMEASEIAEISLNNVIRAEIAKLKSREMVLEAFHNRKNPEILQLPKHCNWVQTLLDIDVNMEVKFCIFPDSLEGYRIQVVPIEKTAFLSRKDLPAEWAGKRNEELNEVVGLSDTIFCHPARFIAGAQSEESILKMAEMALKG